MGRVRVMWAVLLGHSVIYRTHIAYGEIVMFGRPKPLVAGRSQIRQCSITVAGDKRAGEEMAGHGV